MDKKNKSNELMNVDDQHSKNITPANLLDHALNNLSQDQLNSLSERAANMALDIKGKEQYSLLKDGESQKQTRDHIDAFDGVKKESITTRHVVKSEFETATGKRTIESKKGAACFVATAAYNSSDHKTVITLRNWRDSSLSNSNYGRKFINWYYRTGPDLAEKLNRYPYLKPFIRVSLNCFSLVFIRETRKS